VAAEVAHDAAALALREALDGMADIARGVPRAHLGYAAHHRLVGDVHQPLGGPLHLADGIHAARIAVPAVNDQRDVDIDDVALAQRLVVGDAVADDVVDRRAGRPRIAAIAERRWDGVVRHGEIIDETVDGVGGDTGTDDLDKRVEALRHEAT